MKAKGMRINSSKWWEILRINRGIWSGIEVDKILTPICPTKGIRYPTFLSTPWVSTTNERQHFRVGPIWRWI
jgi:hypothetical protein